MSFYRRSIAVFGVVFVCLGIALVVVTAVNGGGGFGYLIGTLFVALGIGRLYLLRGRS
jgi:hypothetical protein